MTPLLYKLGSLKALHELGFKVAAYGASGSDGLGLGTGFGSDPSGEGKSYMNMSGNTSDNPDLSFKGTPFPAKSHTINAERLAEILQSQDDAPMHISPENRRNDAWDRPVTWSASQNMSGLDDGRQATGILMPSNPRG